MKKTFIVLLLFAISFHLNAQCNDFFVYQCAKQSSGQVFLTEFKAEFIENNYRTFKVFLNKGYTYTFRLCNPDINNYSKNRIIKSALSLYDFNNNLIANTLYVDEITFKCNRTNAYWIQIASLEKEVPCAVAVLSCYLAN